MSVTQPGVLEWKSLQTYIAALRWTDSSLCDRFCVRGSDTGDAYSNWGRMSALYVLSNYFSAACHIAAQEPWSPMCFCSYIIDVGFP